MNSHRNLFWDNLPVYIRIVNKYLESINCKIQTVDNSLQKLPFKIPKGLPKKEIYENGKHIVISQSKEFSVGYSDRDDILVNESLPLIVYGDHSKTIKYVNQEFIIGADGVKLLRPKDELFTKYFYYQLFGIKTDTKNYGRHFSLVKKEKIYIPSFDTQILIANFFEDLLGEDLSNKEYFCNQVESSIIDIHKKSYSNQSLLEEIQTQKSLLTQLKQAVLQEAIQGKLTRELRRQNPELISGKNSATILLERIKAEKVHLVKEKKIKKDKTLPPIEKKEIPFELPEGWVWCRLGEILEVVRGSSPRPKGDPRYWSQKRTQFHWMTIADFKPFTKNNTLMDTSGFLTKEGSRHSRKVRKGDLIIACSGVGSVGKSVKIGIDGFIYDGLLGIRDIPKELKTDFVGLFIKYKELQIYSLATGANWLNINTDLLKNYVMPLPPLEEQKAIVEKVEALMEKCSALEQEIILSEQHAQMLMQAVLKEAFAGEKKIKILESIN